MGAAKASKTVGLLACVALGAGACQKLDDHPPTMGCEADANCAPHWPIAKGPKPPDGGTSSDAGSSSDAGALDITGELVVLSDDWVSTFPFNGGASVFAEGASGAFVTGSDNGSGGFALSNVSRSSMTWLGAKPTNTVGVALPTLLAVDTESTATVQLALVQAATIDNIYDILTLPTTRQTGSGQVVVFFVHDDAQRTPVSGISVSMDQAASAIYDAAGTFSDIAGSTGTRGMAILANVPSTTFPGTKHRLLWSGAASGYEEILVAANAVTVIGFRVSN